MYEDHQCIFRKRMRSSASADIGDYYKHTASPPARKKFPDRPPFSIGSVDDDCKVVSNMKIVGVP